MPNRMTLRNEMGALMGQSGQEGAVLGARPPLTQRWRELRSLTRAEG